MDQAKSANGSVSVGNSTSKWGGYVAFALMLMCLVGMLFCTYKIRQQAEKKTAIVKIMNAWVDEASKLDDELLVASKELDKAVEQNNRTKDKKAEDEFERIMAGRLASLCAFNLKLLAGDRQVISQLKTFGENEGQKLELGQADAVLDFAVSRMDEVMAAADRYAADPDSESFNLIREKLSHVGTRHILVLKEISLSIAKMN